MYDGSPQIRFLGLLFYLMPQMASPHAISSGKCSPVLHTYAHVPNTGPLFQVTGTQQLAGMLVKGLEAVLSDGLHEDATLPKSFCRTPS